MSVSRGQKAFTEFDGSVRGSTIVCCICMLPLPDLLSLLMDEATDTLTTPPTEESSSSSRVHA